MAQTSIPVQQVTCPDCKGSGLIQVTIYNTATGNANSYRETCLGCLGTGTVAL